MQCWKNMLFSKSSNSDFFPQVFAHDLYFFLRYLLRAYQWRDICISLCHVSHVLHTFFANYSAWNLLCYACTKNSNSKLALGNIVLRRLFYSYLFVLWEKQTSFLLSSCQIGRFLKRKLVHYFTPLYTVTVQFSSFVG